MSSKSAEFVKLRMLKLSSQSSGQGFRSPSITTYDRELLGVHRANVYMDAAESDRARHYSEKMAGR